MADIDYQVVVHVLRKGVPVDAHVIDDEDYGWAMLRLQKWASDSHAEKDF